MLIYWSGRSVEVISHDGIVDSSLCKKSIFLLAYRVDSCAFIQLEGFELFWAPNFCSHLVLHVLVSLAILKALILFSEAQFSERVNLFFNAVVLVRGNSSV